MEDTPKHARKKTEGKPMKRRYSKTPELPYTFGDLSIEQIESHTWLGRLLLGPEYPACHVEIIELKGKSWHTMDPEYQGWLDNWMRQNEYMKPKVLEIGKRRFFIHIEVYAQ